MNPPALKWLFRNQRANFSFYTKATSGLTAISSLCLSVGHFRTKALFSILVWISLLLCSCKSASTLGQGGDQARKTATAKLGKDVESYPNSTGTHILFIQKSSPSNASNVLKVIVVQASDNAIVVEQSFVPGYAKWITDSSIEVLSVPGMVRENEDLSEYKKVIVIRSKKQ